MPHRWFNELIQLIWRVIFLCVHTISKLYEPGILKHIFSLKRWNLSQKTHQFHAFSASELRTYIEGIPWVGWPLPSNGGKWAGSRFGSTSKTTILAVTSPPASCKKNWEDFPYNLPLEVVSWGHLYIYMYIIYLDLPRGAEWMIRGAYTPSLRVQTAPFGRCWYIYNPEVCYKVCQPYPANLPWTWVSEDSYSEVGSTTLRDEGRNIWAVKVTHKLTWLAGHPSILIGRYIFKWVDVPSCYVSLEGNLRVFEAASIFDPSTLI